MLPAGNDITGTQSRCSESLTPPRSFRWLRHLETRHAIPRALAAPGARGEALCGAEVVVPEKTPPKYPDGLWSERPRCDRQWRRQTGLAQRPQVPAATRRERQNGFTNQVSTAREFWIWHGFRDGPT